MALARCELHEPTGSKRAYVKAVPAAGPGIVCGTDRCCNDAMIWLDSDEYQAYQAKETVFSLPTQAAKVRAKRISN